MKIRDLIQEAEGGGLGSAIGQKFAGILDKGGKTMGSGPGPANISFGDKVPGSPWTKSKDLDKDGDGQLVKVQGQNPINAPRIHSDLEAELSKMDVKRQLQILQAIKQGKV